MNKRFLIAGLVGGIMIAGAGFAARADAGEVKAVAPIAAGALDTVDAEFTRHTREHRMWEIQQNLELQDRQARRGYGPPRDRGYGPPPGAGYRRGYDDGRGYGRGGGRRDWRDDDD